MKKLMILIGLPASGKSTFARELLHEENWKRVNKDSLRTMLDDYSFSKENERFVCKLQEKLIRDLLKQGYDVIVDNTHLKLSTRNQIHEIAQNVGDVEVIEKVFNVSLEECLERNSHRTGTDHVPEHVIRQMAKNPLPKERRVIYLEKAIPIPEIKDDYRYYPPAVVFDIDGTVSDLNGRDPYDMSTCENDLPNWGVLNLVILYYSQRYSIFFITGRGEESRAKTEAWLRKYVPGVRYTLFMRETGDQTKDFIIKKAIYDEHIKGKYNIVGWFEDRQRCCKMAYELGLPVFKVGDPESDF